MSAPTSDHLKALYQQVINWRYHSNRLYEFQQTQMLEWPSLTVDWIADRKALEPERDFALHYLAVGTQALPGTQNYLAVIEMAVPIEREDAESYYGLVPPPAPQQPVAATSAGVARGNDGSAGVSVGSGGANGERLENQPPPQYTGAVDANGNPMVLESDIDPSTRYENVRGHSRVAQLVMMEAAVLRLRCMPQHANITAVKLANGVVAVYDLGRRPAFTTDVAALVPDVRLKGHRKAGFGLSWSPLSAGLLASGSDDMLVLTYDIEGCIDSLGTEPQADALPLSSFVGHSDFVHDVAWHATQDHLLASASEDSTVKVWDTRSPTAVAQDVQDAHRGAAFGVAFHHTAVFQFATCGADRMAKLWDLRRTQAPVQQLIYHGAGVTSVAFAPFSDTVLATAGTDRRVVFWDFAKLGQEASDAASDAHAPPELSFVHTGHVSRVTDFAWCTNLDDEWLCASTDMTNTLQVYKPRGDIVYDYVVADAFDGEDAVD